MTSKKILLAAIAELNDLKAIDLTFLDVRKFSALMDYMIIVTGTSSRHVHSLAENLAKEMRAQAIISYNVEKDQNDEWILVDLGHVVVHIMQAKTREFYNLENLWSTTSTKSAKINEKPELAN